jgi:hypothetical protein
MPRGSFDIPREELEQGWDEHAPMICPRSKEACVRAFCEDYGCADNAGVPIDANDMAAGSIHPDELIQPLPRSVRRKT